MAALLKILDVLTQILIIVGALNWGLVGFLGLNVVDRLVGEDSVWSFRIYAIVGLAAVYQILRIKAVTTCMIAPHPPREVPLPH
jgi:uncharacterized protein